MQETIEYKNIWKSQPQNLNRVGKWMKNSCAGILICQLLERTQTLSHNLFGREFCHSAFFLYLCKDVLFTAHSQ